MNDSSTTTRSGDETLRAVAVEIHLAAPAPRTWESLDADSVRVLEHHSPGARRGLLAVAAVSILVAGVAATILVTGRDVPANVPAASDELPGVRPPLNDAIPPNCTRAGQEVPVPNVAGLPYLWAIDALGAAGLEIDAVREEAPDGTEGPDEQYTIVQQDVAPLQMAACGSVVGVTAAYRPGTLHIVAPGDTYDSIAAVEGVPIELLLDYNGLTATELQAAGESTTEPLSLGQAIRLIPGTAPQRFILAESADGVVVTDIVDRQGGIVSLVLGEDRFAGVTIQIHIVPGQYDDSPTNFQPEAIQIRQTTGVIVRPADGSVSVLWQEDGALAIELAATPTTDRAVMPTDADLVEIAGRLEAVNDTEWAAFRATHQ